MDPEVLIKETYVKKINEKLFKYKQNKKNIEWKKLNMVTWSNLLLNAFRKSSMGKQKWRRYGYKY